MVSIIDKVDFSISKKSPSKTNRQLDESLFKNKTNDSSLKRTSSILEDEDELLYSEDDEEEENMTLKKSQVAENDTHKIGIILQIQDEI